MFTETDRLKNFDLRSFMNDPSKHSPFKLKKDYGSLSSILADQLLLYKKAAVKLPSFTEKYCYFTKKSLEQSSSERTAIYKSGLFSGNKMLDLTGGLGVDDREFSKSFKKVISIDKDSALNELARLNFEKLDINNIVRIDADAYEFIKSDDSFELVYIDADRRITTKKAITLDNSEPNVLHTLNRLFELTSMILLKLSPLIDITYLCKTLQDIKEIRVVSVNNEVKEVLAVLQKNYSGIVNIYAVDLASNRADKIFGPYSGKQTNSKINNSGKFFYEPSAAIIKAGLVNEYAAANKLSTVSHNSVFLTGDCYTGDFMGRAFIVNSKILFSKSAIKKYLKGRGIAKANVSCRNFPVKEEGIKKLFKLKDGGNDYLFFTTGLNKQKLMFHCMKPSSDDTTTD